MSAFSQLNGQVANTRSDFDSFDDWIQETGSTNFAATTADVVVVFRSTGLTVGGYKISSGDALVYVNLDADDSAEIVISLTGIRSDLDDDYFIF